MKSKVLAIYLPQFHTIPENDKWWGKGFTEWTNVKRGRPFYPGHYQPRIPFGNNYYDLSDLKVLESQIKIAKRAGIYGFGFYHYYFKGRTLLEKPIEKYRDFSNQDFPYCLIWANQSWAKTWYRADSGNRILLEQSYGTKKDWESQFYYLLTFFKDKRYIKIDNKPVYIIYIPQDIPCRRHMFRVWDEMAKEHGFNGIYLIAMKTSYGEDKYKYLYASYMDFEPLHTFYKDCSWRKKLQDWKRNIEHKQFTGKQLRNMLIANNAFTYSYLTKQSVKNFKKNGKNTYAGIFAGWDNSPRKDEDGVIVHGSSPVKFEKAVSKLLRLSEQMGKEFVFINAWNEWSEGAYLEPDEKYGYAYLKALRRAIKANS